MLAVMRVECATLALHLNLSMPWLMWLTGKVTYPTVFEPSQQQGSRPAAPYYGAPTQTGGAAGRREDLWSANNIGRDGSAFEDAKQVQIDDYY